MNKTELAKLLIKHPEIKALYESQAFDASTINKVIAEEIKEQLSADQKDQIDTLKGYLELLMDQGKSIMSDLKDAKLDGDKEWTAELEADLESVKQKRLDTRNKIKAIQATAKKAAEAAIQTEPTEDDQQVAQALKTTTDAMRPAVDAAKQDVDIATKVDAVAPAVQDAADAAKNGLGDIEIVDDEGGSNDSSNDDSGEEQNNETIIASAKPDEEEIIQTLVDLLNQDDNDDSDAIDKLKHYAKIVDPKVFDQAIRAFTRQKIADGNKEQIASQRETLLDLDQLNKESEDERTKRDEFHEKILSATKTSELKQLSRDIRWLALDPFDSFRFNKAINSRLDAPSLFDVEDDAGTAQFSFEGGLEGEQEPAAVEENMVNCPTCKSPNPESARFCGYCGTNMETGEPLPPDPESVNAAEDAATTANDEEAGESGDDASDQESVSATEDALVDQTISSVVQDVSAVDVAKTIGTLALDVGKNLLPSGIKNSLQTGLDFLNDQELWLKAAESAVKGDYDGSAEIVATELVEKVQERFELASLEDGMLKNITIAAMKPALSTGIKLAVESGADNVIDGAKELYSDAKETIEQAFTPSEEGTREAEEAIEDGVPENVENIQPADVQAAEEQLESEIEASPEMQANAEELETKVEKNKMATSDKRSLENKIHKLKNAGRFEDIVKIMEILGKEDSTIDEIKSVWPSVPEQRIPGYKAALENLPEGARQAVAKAKEGMSTNPENEEVQQAAVEAAAEVEKAITTFEEKIENFRNKSAQMIATKSGKDASTYTQMNVMQDAYFVMFLFQQLSKAKETVAESILREEANFNTSLLQQAINDNKEEVETIATDSGIDLAAAIKAKFGIDIQAQPKDTSMKDVADQIKSDYEEKMGTTDGLKKFLGDLFLANKNDDGSFDLEAIKAQAAEQLNIDKDDESAGDDSGMESGEADNIIATTLQSLNSKTEDFPELLGNEQFKSLLAMALRNAGVDLGQSSDTGAEEGEELVDADSDQTLGESLSGIYLMEEDPPTPSQGDEETGAPLSTDEASGLFSEIQKMQELFDGQEKLKTINIMDLARQAGLDVPDKEASEELSEVPSVEEATQEGQNAAQDDAELPDARYQDLYAGFKEQMDTFFSLDGKNDGFMDQFLLKYQAAKLAELIGNLDLIIGGGTGGKDDEGEARAFSTATQQADANLNEAQEQEISEKGQIELKTRLVAMLKGLKSLKAMMNSYKQNATRSSANPKLDGSALKKSLQRYMSNLQINIKAIVETCYIEHSKLTQTQSDDVDLNEPSGDEATPPTGDDTNQNVEDPQPSAQNEQLYEAILEAIAPALDGVYLMEDAAREEKMNIVNTIYGQMKEEIYLPSMQSALEKTQKETAMKNASQMMELAKKEEFVALFPTFVGSFGGKPQTIDQAVDAIDGLLKEFIETMKKVIVLAKGATIDETTLAKVIEDLSMMSLMMQNYFGVKSLLDDEMQARVEKMLAQRAENQSLSDVPKPSNERSGGEFMDKAKELARKGLEKLKQLFAKLMEWLRSKDWGSVLSWFDQNKIEDVLPEGSGFELDADEVVATIKNFENEDNALGFLQDLEKSTNWYKDLGSRMQPIWDKFIKALRQGQNLQEAYSGFDVISDKLMKTEFKITEDMLNQALGKLEQAEQNMISDIIGNSYDLASSFIYHVLKGTIKLSETSDASNQDADDLEITSRTVTGTDGFDDEDEIPEPERFSKSEKEMSKLINILSGSGDTKIKKVIARSEAMFEDDSKQMLSLMVYYILDGANRLQKDISEQPVRPPRDKEGSDVIKKINTFLNEMLKQSRLTVTIKDFIKGSRSKIVNFLKSKDVENLIRDYATGEGFLMSSLKKRIDKSIETKKIVDFETEDTTTDSDDVMSAEVEFDDSEERPEGTFELSDQAWDFENKDPGDLESQLSLFRTFNHEKLNAFHTEKGFIANNTTMQEIAENFGLELKKPDDYNSADLISSAITGLAQIVKILKSTTDGEDEISEGVASKVRSMSLKSAIKRTIQKINPSAKKMIIKPLEEVMADLLPNIKINNNTKKAIMRLLNSIVKHEGDLKKVAEDSKNVVATTGSLGGSGSSNSKEAGQKIAATSGEFNLEESLKPIIEKMLKEHYNH